VRKIADFKPGQKFAYFLDVAPESFQDAQIKSALLSAKTIFINAVMGFTPNFAAGSARMYEEISKNEKALKLYGGGDTLTALKDLTPGLYLKALDDPSYYFFTGGGAVLSAIEAESAYGLKPVSALLT
ncbi:MAG: phosphoglycerate kinase, partial [Candidatus Adiutrix sp.]